MSSTTTLFAKKKNNIRLLEAKDFPSTFKTISIDSITLSVPSVKERTGHIDGWTLGATACPSSFIESGGRLVAFISTKVAGRRAGAESFELFIEFCTDGGLSWTRAMNRPEMKGARFEFWLSSLIARFLVKVFDVTSEDIVIKVIFFFF